MGRGPGFGIVKWLGGGLLAGLLGYAVVGPHFAAKTKTGQRVQEEVAQVFHRREAAPETPAVTPNVSPERGTPDDYAAAPASGAKVDVPAPTVSVGVKPVEAGAPDETPAPTPRRRRRRHRRHRTATSEEAPPEATPATPERTAPDPASTAP